MGLPSKVGWSKPGIVLTGYNRTGKYSRSGHYWSIEKLSGRLTYFSGHFKNGDVFWVFSFSGGVHYNVQLICQCKNCLFCLFDLILYVPSTIFQLNRDGSSWVEPVLS